MAECYRQLLGLHYRDGEDLPTDGSPDDADWLVLFDDTGNRLVTVEERTDTTPPTWPSEKAPMQMHMDFKVPTVEELERHREHAEKMGARLPARFFATIVLSSPVSAELSPASGFQGNPEWSGQVWRIL